MDIQLAQYKPGNYTGSRPLRVNKNTGAVQVQTERGLLVNSMLRKDEWQALDAEIQQAAKIRLNGVAHLRERGLVKPLGSLGILTSQWSQGSEMDAANVDMTGQGNKGADRQEFLLKGAPVPVVYKDFSIPSRQLEASRLMGSPLDTANAMTAARVVAEKLEDLLFNGSSATIFDGNTLYGYTTEANVNTGSASGDWGTISNVASTVTSMIAAANGDRYFGPFAVYASTTQYTQAATSFYTDGSGESAMNRVMRIPEVTGFYPSDVLTDGTVVLVQMTSDVVDWAEHMGITVVEWMSNDGMIGFFKVMAVATPRVKSDYSGKSGIVVFTGA
jgi:uncharacterized linocin/CFP29 family protein